MRAGAEAPLRAAVVMVVAVLTVLPGCGGDSGQPMSPGSSPPSAAGPAASPTSATTSDSRPNTRPPGAVAGALADPPPTLGELCTPGYTRTVRPPRPTPTPSSAASWPTSGTPTGTTHYEEDHLVPLSIGGAPRDERNLWPQPWPEARDKDREEDALHIGVCTHRMSLAEAQRKIVADWGPG